MALMTKKKKRLDYLTTLREAYLNRTTTTIEYYVKYTCLSIA